LTGDGQKQKNKTCLVKIAKDSSCGPEMIGKNILEDMTNATVVYKRKKYDLHYLVEMLAQKVKELEKNQCNPTVKCLFKGRDLLDSLGKDEIRKILKESECNG